MPRPSVTIENIWCRIDKRGPNECWLWTGPKNDGMGYGRFEKDGRSYYAHRVIYSITNPGTIEWKGPINRAAGMLVLHICDNPVCCNPKHLILGTHADNMRDKVERGRSPDYSKGKGPRCKLTMEDVFWIKLQHKHGATLMALALLYDVSRVTIKSACSGRHYKDVLESGGYQ
jgi:HNH endonuclease